MSSRYVFAITCQTSETFEGGSSRTSGPDTWNVVAHDVNEAQDLLKRWLNHDKPRDGNGGKIQWNIVDVYRIKRGPQLIGDWSFEPEEQPQEPEPEEPLDDQPLPTPVENFPHETLRPSRKKPGR